jgi:hypothetical protein
MGMALRGPAFTSGDRNADAAALFSRESGNEIAPSADDAEAAGAVPVMQPAASRP